MASIHKVPASPNWIAYYRTTEGKQKCRSTGLRATEKNRVNALRFADAAEKALRDQRALERMRRVLDDIAAEMHDESRPAATVRQFFTRWLQTKLPEVSRSTLAYYDLTVRHFLEWLAKSADRDMGTITRTRLLEYRDHFAEGRAANTVNTRMDVLKIIFRQARRERVIFSDPSEGIAGVKTSREPARRPFTLDELRAVVAASHGEWRGLVLFGIYTGQRLGDIVALRWENVDMEANAGSGVLRFTTAKTGRSQHVPLHAAIRDYLATVPAGDQPGDSPLFPAAVAAVARSGGRISPVSSQFASILAAAGLRKKPSSDARGVGRDQVLARVYGVHRLSVQRWYALGEAANDPCPATRPAELLKWYGRRMDRRPVRGILEAARKHPDEIPDVPTERLKRGGPGLKREMPRLSFHSLRHTATSLLKASGIPASVVMDLIGHDDAAMSQHYTHTGDDERRRAIDSLPTL